MSNDIDNENENPEVSEPKDETFMPMESDSGSDDDEGPKIIARQDRIPLWSLSYIFIGILGMGYIFVFFDIFNINVSFTQTAMLLGLGSSPTDPKIASALAIAVLLNLIGYVIGALALTPLSDRFGRREMLVITLLITGIGSICNAFVTDFTGFVFWRFITGIGIGADLAIVNAYINEVAPTKGRAKYTSLLFILAGIGVVIGIWLGLFLTTPSAPFPDGLSWAIGGSGYAATNGWRLMYGIGGILAILGVILRVGLPESTRWLITHGRIKDAEKIVSDMEKRALAHIKELPPIPDVLPVVEKPKPIPYSEIFKNPMYRNRTILLFLVWFFGYMTVYIFAGGLTILLGDVGFQFPKNGLIVASGIFGFVIAGFIASLLGDKIERKRWLPISAVITLIGGIMISEGTSNLALAIVGTLVLFTGTNIWVPISYAWVSESFPTRARASGFALADGLGHIGGGIGLLIVAVMVALTSNILIVFIVIILFQIISAIISQFGPSTANKRLDEISP